MTTFMTVTRALLFIFEQADRIAIETGFIKRTRKVTGSNFIKALLFAWMQAEPPSVEGLARSGFPHGLCISAQGIDQRFTNESCSFVRSVLEQAIKKRSMRTKRSTLRS